MARVSLARCGSYEQKELARALGRAIEDVCPLTELVRPGQKVLLKPNLLSSHANEKRVTTDPSLVLAVGRLVQEAGGEVLIGDSPALESCRRVARKTGIAQVADELGCQVVELSQPTPAPPDPQAMFRNLELARQVLEADVVINLPKLKTHCQMLVTLGVKNMFGSVVAQRKTEWHHMAGVDRGVFASLLLDVWRASKPALTILDGVWGMEGRGPANGNPRFFGFVAASQDALSLDLAVCDLLGIKRSRVPIFQQALTRGILPGRVDLAGDDPAGLNPGPIDLPELDSLNILPGFLAGLSKNFLVSRPVQLRDRCVACAKCVEICPAGAMALEGPVLKFDYDRCIRCYCCQEICPQDAIGFKKGLLVRMLQGIKR